MVQYWNCGELPWPDIEEFVDQNVGEALKHFIEKEGNLFIDWKDGEPLVEFFTGDHFHYRQSLYEILVFEIGNLRPGGPDATDLFFDHDGDRGIILLQELIRTYLKWKEGKPNP